MIFQILSSPAEFWGRALEQTLAAIRKSLELRPDCRLGLAGGSTPRSLYAALAAEKLPWEKIKIITIDERRVPPEHPESNQGMINDALGRLVDLPKENLIVFDTSLPPSKAIAAMEQTLASLLRVRRPLFDFLILGAGADGHVASLFFDAPSLKTETRLAVPSRAAGYPVEPRFTLTLRALGQATAGLLLLAGPEKHPVAEALRGGAALPYPALLELASAVPLETLVLP